MDEERIEKLAAIMSQRHGRGAEAIARKRALRCKRIQQTDWARTWEMIATYIAASQEPQRNQA